LLPRGARLGGVIEVDLEVTADLLKAVYDHLPGGTFMLVGVIRSAVSARLPCRFNTSEGDEHLVCTDDVSFLPRNIFIVDVALKFLFVTDIGPSNDSGGPLRNKRPDCVVVIVSGRVDRNRFCASWTICQALPYGIGVEG
jgi:hypothetical protein